jgi:hypothetical protein
MYPAWLDLNLTPSSQSAPSAIAGTAGVAEGAQSVQGQFAGGAPDVVAAFE